MQNIFTGKQIAVLVVGIITIIAGYLFLAQGPVDNQLSLSVAPLLLVGGYCVIIPVALILGGTKTDSSKKSGV